MTRNRDPLALTPHWHVDFRLEAELPEDNIVGTRFLINTVFAAVALAALLFAGWLGYLSFNLRHQISDWEQRIKENRPEVLDIRRMQTEYAVEGAKIDQAYTLVRSQFFVSDLIANLGRTRPDVVVIDIIDWNDAGIVIRGNLRAPTQVATETLGNYIKALIADEKIGALFESIKMTDLAPGTTGDATKFEISLKPRPLKP